MSIESKIRMLIQKKGYVPLDEVIAIAMYKQDDSYYRISKAIGCEEDFITAPEVSQLFGEMIGVWIWDVWQKMGSPNSFHLVELGAGLGTLMRDILKVLSRKRQIYEAINLWIIDINPILKQKQRDTLTSFNISKAWITSIEQVPAGVTIIVGNEFFDALPVKQYIKEKDEWKERVIITDPRTNELTFDTRSLKKILLDYLISEYCEAYDGAIVEESPQSIKVMQTVARHIQDNKGAALIIDYGYEINPKLRKQHQFVPTLQAVKQHKYVPILASLGRADLSSHVDFWALKKAASSYSIKVWNTISQRKFLASCGINLRLNSLIAKNPHLSDLLARQYNRLVGEDQMGELFRVICITSDKQIVPLGYES